MFVVQLQCSDKCNLQFGKKMKRAAQKSNVAFDGFTACKSADGLIYYSLKNRSRQIFFGCSVIDQGLDISFGKYTAAGCDSIKRLVTFGILIQTGCVRLE